MLHLVGYGFVKRPGLPRLPPFFLRTKNTLGPVAGEATVGSTTQPSRAHCHWTGHLIAVGPGAEQFVFVITDTIVAWWSRCRNNYDQNYGSDSKGQDQIKSLVGESFYTNLNGFVVVLVSVWSICACVWCLMLLIFGLWPFIPVDGMVFTFPHLARGMCLFTVPCTLSLSLLYWMYIHLYK